MDFLKMCIVGSSLSFFAYVLAYFKSPHMKVEFKRFGLEKLGLLTIILELAGASGLLLGLLFKPLLTISALGLAVLMLAAVVVRIKLKDGIWISLPAIFYMCLNFYIFWASVK